VPLLLLITVSMIDSGRRARFATGSMAAALVLVSIARVQDFNRWVEIKSIASFTELQAAIPRGAIVEVRVEGPLAFEWATYYLRDLTVIYTQGELVYFRATEADKSSEKARLVNAEFLVTDRKLNADAIWSNKAFYLYALKEPCSYSPCASDSNVASPVVARRTPIE
jgi:hypothetical protein